MEIVNAEQLKSLNIEQIARLIKRTWSKVNYAAVPYLDAMLQMDSVNDAYGYDDGKSIVRYFLANANAFKGEQARLIKAELKSRLK